MTGDGVKSHAQERAVSAAPGALQDWVARYERTRLLARNVIDGRSRAAKGEAISKHGPRDGRLLCRFGVDDSRELDEAVAAAKRAFDRGSWASLSIERRKVVLYELASLIESHKEELALLECLDVGKPIRNVLDFDIPTAAAIIRYDAEAADKLHGKVFAVDRSSLSYQLCRPFGVVAGIVGWNFPLVLAAGKVGPVLATGNSLILKPSEVTPLATARLAELALEAGVPPGVFNVVNGGRHVGAALARHSDVDLITFTGSTATGKKLLVGSGESTMKRMILECGGKAPNIVFDDAPDLDSVADAVIARAFWNQGQVCTASSRVLVHENVKDEILPRLIQRAAMLNPGDPLLPETTFGALVSLEQKQKVLDYIERGKSEGAELAHYSSSTPPHQHGFYVPPAIFDRVKPEHKIAQDEIFGPVLSVLSFRDEAEAIAIANGTIYGLSALLWTRDMGRAHRVTQALKAGWITVNATANPEGGPGVGVLTVGGHKQSGMGVEGGLEGLEAYMAKTAVQFFV